MSLVVDSSVALGWIYSDGTTDALEQAMRRVAEHGAWVPSHWRLEVANVLEMNVRRKRHPAAFRDAAITDLADLPIKVDGETDRQAWDATLRLAIKHRLTTYDAAYLELAQRKGLSLATLDGELRAAAEKEGVPLLTVSARG